MKKLIMVLASTVICGAMLLISCSKRTSQTEQQYTGVPLVILDTDIGSSADDLFALEMLYRYDEQGLCRLLGVVVDREGEDCAACADVMGTYFGYGDTPLGLVRDGIKNPKGWIDYKAVPTHAESRGQITQCLHYAEARKRLLQNKCQITVVWHINGFCLFG